jgi:UDP-N-acetylglucosamine acyltransferase
MGDGCRLGEYATVHRSATAAGETSLGDGVLVMAYAHVAHDCAVGDGAVLANGVQLGGHVVVGRHSFLGGGAHVHQHVRIGEMAFAAGGIRLDRELAPWSRAMGEPPRWAGLNRIAFSRAPEPGNPVRAQAALRILFRTGLRLEQAMEVLASRPDPESIHLARFIQGGIRGLLRPKR